MCYHFFVLSRDVETYDVVKFIGESVGYTMIDVMDTMTVNPWNAVDSDVEDDSIASEFNFWSVDMGEEDTVSIEYNLEVGEDTLDSDSDNDDVDDNHDGGGYDTDIDDDDDDSIIDLTCQE